MTRHDSDILVIGGGLAGLAFAALLGCRLRERRPDLSLTVLESGSPPALMPSTEVGLRVIAVSPASRAILEECGAWGTLPETRVGPYRRMVVWHGKRDGGRPETINFDAAEAGVRELGFIVENDVLRAALWTRAKALPNIEMLCGAAAELLDDRDHLAVVLNDGRRLRARLLVAADGAASWARQALAVPLAQRSYAQNAIVAHVRSERPHRQTAWQKFLPSGPVALLPLADGRSSLVWSCADDLAAELLGLDAQAFAERLTEETDRVLGRLEINSARASFPLGIAHAARYTGRRYALIGDAAHRVHPLAGLGVNLGFLDAEALADTLTHSIADRWVDPGDPRVLRRFERQRRGSNLLALGTLDLLHRVFTSSSPLVGEIAGTCLGLVDRMPPVKRWFSDYAMGPRGGGRD